MNTGIKAPQSARGSYTKASGSDGALLWSMEGVVLAISSTRDVCGKSRRALGQGRETSGGGQAGSSGWPVLCRGIHLSPSSSCRFHPSTLIHCSQSYTVISKLAPSTGTFLSAKDDELVDARPATLDASIEQRCCSNDVDDGTSTFHYVR